MKAFACGIFGAWMLWTTVSVAASSQNPSQGLSIGASPSQELEDKGFDHFYNLEYDDSVAIFQKLRDSDPGIANWRNDLAAAIFYRRLLNAGVMQGDLFTGSNRFFRTKKLPPDAAFEKDFHDANDSAISLCEGRLKKNPKDQDALYDCGVAYADRAAFEGLVARAYVETIVDARKASDYHVQLARLSPQSYDAYFIPGLYSYVLGSLPPSLKFLLYIGGFSGDKARGIQAVEGAARYGIRSKQDAKILLAVMYRREKRFDDARHQLEELVQSYPRNYDFALEIGSLYRNAGQQKEAIRVYEKVLNDVRAGKPGYSRAPLARIHYELGDLYWQEGDLEAAKSHFEQVAGSQGSNAELEVQNAAMQRQVEEAMRARQPDASGVPIRCCAEH